MQYRLTEEQSTEFFNNMLAIDGYGAELNSVAVKIVREWYVLYTNNLKWYNWPRSFDKFLKVLAKWDGLELKTTTLGYESLNHFNSSGWVVEMNVERICKMTGLSFEKVQDDADKVWSAVSFMYKNSSFLYRNSDILHDIKHYCQVPYTLDDKKLHHMKACEKIVEEYMLEV